MTSPMSFLHSALGLLGSVLNPWQVLHNSSQNLWCRRHQRTFEIRNPKVGVRYESGRESVRCILRGCHCATALIEVTLQCLCNSSFHMQCISLAVKKGSVHDRDKGLCCQKRKAACQKQDNSRLSCRKTRLQLLWQPRLLVGPEAQGTMN